MPQDSLLVDLGRLDYGPAWEFQKRAWQLRVDGKIPDALILVEHQPVITLGKSGKLANLLLPEAELKRRGINLFRVERGGDITYHGPGQLVGYPVFRLEGALAGVRRFVERVQQSLIQVLRTWHIAAELKPGLTGVWVGDRKIAAIGIAVRRFVTFHGFALNVNTDLAGFQAIVPCGIAGKGVTSVARELGRELSLSVVKHEVANAFGSVFDREFRPVCPDCLTAARAPR